MEEGEFHYTKIGSLTHSLLDIHHHSVFSNPRIRVDIKNEAVTEEDASQSAVALSRVSTLLREVGIHTFVFYALLNHPVEDPQCCTHCEKIARTKRVSWLALSILVRTSKLIIYR